MTEHLDAVLILIHAGGIAGLINIFNDVLNISTNVFPSLSHLLEVAFEISLFEKCLLTALFVLLSQIS